LSKLSLYVAVDLLCVSLKGDDMRGGGRGDYGGRGGGGGGGRPSGQRVRR